MPKETPAMSGKELGEPVAQGVLEIIKSAGRAFSKIGLWFTAGLFDGIEIGTVGRQETQGGATSQDELLDRWGFVDAEVVEDDDVARADLRAEDPVDVGLEHIHVGRALDQERRVDAVQPEGGDEGRGLPVAVGHLAEAPAPSWAPAPKSGHLRIERRLVDKDQMAWIPIGLLAAPASARPGYVRAILLGGVRRFFLNLGPCA